MGLFSFDPFDKLDSDDLPSLEWSDPLPLDVWAQHTDEPAIVQHGSRARCLGRTGTSEVIRTDTVFDLGDWA